MLYRPVCALVLALLCRASAYCGELPGKACLGFNYPGASLRYFVSKKAALELKGQFDKDASLYGGRGYYYFGGRKTGNLSLFAGLEYDAVTFKGTVSKGKGSAAGFFVGDEYFISRHVSLQTDIGPMAISLRDNATAQAVDGVEFVFNVGLNLYFWK